MLILYAQNVYYLYVARLLNGIVGGGVFCCVPLFLFECADDGIRGILGATFVLSSNVGILLAFIFGHYFDYDVTPKLVIGLTCLFAISMIFFPETPLTLVKQGKIDVSIRKFRINFGKRHCRQLLFYRMQ